MTLANVSLYQNEGRWGLLQGRGSGLRYGHFLRVNGVKEERFQTGKLIFPEYKQERSVPA